MQPCARLPHLMDITHKAPRWRAEEIAMEVVATVMLTAIVLYMLQQVQDL